jgi:hypothetical protein
VVALPGIKTSQGVSCATVRDATVSSWNASFEDIQCYDALRVDALLNEIAGKSHTGSAGSHACVFGMNFQAVYTGESVSEPGVGNGGYQERGCVAQRGTAARDRVRGHLDRRHRQRS